MKRTTKRTTKRTIELTLEIPDWAEWIAGDKEDGDGFVVFDFFQKKPECFKPWGEWQSDGNASLDAIKIRRKYLPKNYDWTKTLRRLKDYR